MASPVAMPSSNRESVAPHLDTSVRVVWRCSQVSGAIQSRAVPHSKEGGLECRHLKAQSFVQLLSAWIRRNHRQCDRHSARCRFFDHALDYGSADALTLMFRKHLEFVNVNGIGLVLHQQATHSPTVALDDGHYVFTKAAIEISPSPSPVPAPRLFDDLAHGATMKRVQEFAIFFRCWSEAEFHNDSRVSVACSLRLCANREFTSDDHLRQRPVAR